VALLAGLGIDNFGSDSDGALRWLVAVDAFVVAALLVGRYVATDPANPSRSAVVGPVTVLRDRRT
jgi:hypothetical protein